MTKTWVDHEEVEVVLPFRRDTEGTPDRGQNPQTLQVKTNDRTPRRYQTEKVRR